jgi:hypothetical protein
MKHWQADQPLIGVFGDWMAIFGVGVGVGVDNGLETLAVVEVPMHRNVVNIHADILRAHRSKDFSAARGKHFEL